jgi:hypothetical protein
MFLHFRNIKALRQMAAVEHTERAKLLERKAELEVRQYSRTSVLIRINPCPWSRSSCVTVHLTPTYHRSSSHDRRFS